MNSLGFVIACLSRWVNRLWGYTRISGALYNLGYEISRSTVCEVLKAAGIEPAPERGRKTTWSEFLKAHWEVLAAADFFNVEVWTRWRLVRYDVLFVMRLATREVQIAGIVPSANGMWMEQFGVKKPSLKAIARTPAIPSLNLSDQGREGEGRGVVLQPAAVNYWLGVKLHALEGEEFSAFGIRKEDGGIALVEVPKTAATARAGLQANDLIQGVNGRKVSQLDQFFKALAGAGSAPLKLQVVRDQQVTQRTIAPPSYIEVEVASGAGGFQKLPLPRSAAGRITANQQTKNSPIESLTDGTLAEGYGPIFGNGVRSGAYKMDLGRGRSIEAITSWSFNQSQSRGAQKLTLYGSNVSIDPGWDLSGFTVLGTIDTTDASGAAYTAASLRAAAGHSLGEFRWIMWAVSPVTSVGGGENTAFQELSVEMEDE